MKRIIPTVPLLALVLGLAIAAGCSEESSGPTEVVEEPPASPGDLFIFDTSPSAVSLRWRDRSADETGFRVERAPVDTGNYAEVDTVAADVTRFLDTSVEAGATYEYRIFSYVGDRDSEPSNEVTVTTVTNTAPQTPEQPAPADLTQDLSPDSTITLQWSSSDPDGDPVAFDVFFGNSRGNLELVSGNQTATSHTINQPLNPNRFYYWRVTAKDSKGVWRPSPIWVFSTVFDRVSVPGGYFVMGDTTKFVHPGNPIEVGPFNLDKFEVTNAQYASFLNQALGRREIRISGGSIYSPDGRLEYYQLRSETGDRGDRDADIEFQAGDSIFVVVTGRDRFPVNEVSWYGADAYARFFARRLPTEAEWEKAARGTSTLRGTRVFFGPETLEVGLGLPYPWGIEPEETHGNFLASGDPFESQGRVRSTPVGFYDGTTTAGYATEDGTSEYGAADMAGNLYEWCQDWHEVYVDPHRPPATGNQKVIRGGSFSKGIGSAQTWIRSAIDPAVTDRTIGFRTAANGLLPGGQPVR